MKTCFRRLVTALAETAFLAVLAAVSTSCDHEPGFFSIDTPGSFENVNALTAISGRWESGTYVGTLVDVKVKLMRYSDNKYWNGTSWGGSFELPTTVGSGTWEVTAALPSGADLQTDYYLIEAYADFSYEDSTHNVMFTVGVPAPPVMPAPWAWGNNGDGQMGVGQLSGGATPLPVFMRGVLEGKIITGMAAGGRHTLALSSEGRLYSWGKDWEGQLGSTAPPDTGGAGTQNNFAPVKVDDTGVLAGKKIAFMAAGSSHSLACSEGDGLVFAWGANGAGQIGNGTSGAGIALPVAVTGVLAGKHVIAVSAGTSHSVALTDTPDGGKLYAWGANGAGQVGDGTTGTDRTTPVAVAGLGSVVITSVDCGAHHNLAVSSEGKLYAWGMGASGRLGTGSTANASTPVLITGPWGVKKIVSVSAATSHSLAVDEDGKVYAWGDNAEGQLGTGDLTQRLTPVQVGGVLVGQDIHRVQAGGDFSITQTHDNRVFTWGANHSGQLARSTAPDDFSHTPQEAVLTTTLSGGRVILGLSAGDFHVEMLTGFTPRSDPEIEVEAQGTVLTDGTGPGINFGAQSYGASVPVYVTVRNVAPANSGAPLANLEAWIDGPDGADYWTIFVGPSVAPGDSTGFYVFFQPYSNANPAPTTHNAVLHIQSNDSDENTFDIELTGTGYPAGKPESGFTAGSGVTLSATAMQPDGKILMGGSFTSLQPTGSASPVPYKNLGRLNADGTLDAGFRPDPDNWVRCMAVQRDGKILIGGQFNTLQPGGTGTIHTRNYLARLNADGTVDTDFVANLNGLVRGILPLADGRILICGQFTTVNNGSGAEPRNRIALLNENGTPDPGFIPNANGEVLTMALDRSNRLYVAGYFSGIGGATRYNVARLNMNDGTADDFTTVQSAYVYALAIDEDGAVLMGGDFTIPLPGGGSVSNFIRVMSNGAIDEFCRPNPGYYIYGINVQADGSFLVSGSFSAVQPHPDLTPTTRNRMARFFSNGSLDISFDPNFNGDVFGATIQSDGKIVPSGSFTTVGGQPGAGTARLSSTAATDNLTIPSLSYIQWERLGGLAQTHDVWFDLSTDGGSTWTPLSGTVSRSPTGWQMTGISLPSTGRVRGRARVISGHHQGSSGIVERAVIYGEPPDIAVLKNGLPIAFGHSHDFGVVGTGSASGSIILTIQNNGGSPLTGLRGFSLAGSTHFSFTGPASGTVAAGGNTTLTVNFQPRTQGIHSAILHLNSNDPDTPAFDILLSGTGSLPVTTWKQIHLGQTENTGDAADTSDTSDHDGNTVLEEYALKLDPNAADRPVMSITLGGGGSGFAPGGEGGGTASDGPGGGSFFFNYSRNKLALADVIFQVEWSDTLAENDWHTTGVTEAVISETGDIQQVQATVPAGTADRRFVRLKMTRP